MQFKNALTVHPVSDPEQMYRLHRHFTKIELRRTYDEITKLQVNHALKALSLLSLGLHRFS